MSGSGHALRDLAAGILEAIGDHRWDLASRLSERLPEFAADADQIELLADLHDHLRSPDPLTPSEQDFVRRELSELAKPAPFEATEDQDTRPPEA